jgi:hypothetical protein
LDAAIQTLGAFVLSRPFNSSCEISFPVTVETLAEGQVRTTPQEVAEFFQGLNAARVVLEVGK